MKTGAQIFDLSDFRPKTGNRPPEAQKALTAKINRLIGAKKPNVRITVTGNTVRTSSGIRFRGMNTGNRIQAKEGTSTMLITTIKRQKQIYQYIKNYSEANGYPPSVRDIARGVGIKSTSTVHNDLRELEKNGLLRIDGKKSRSIVLVEPEPDAAELRKIASRLGAYCHAQDSCDGCLFSEQDMFGESGCTLAGVIFGRGAEVYVPWETAKNKRSKRRK